MATVSVGWPGPRSVGREHCELLSEGEVFQEEVGAGGEEVADRCKDEANQCRHWRSITCVEFVSKPDGFHGGWIFPRDELSVLVRSLPT